MNATAGISEPNRSRESFRKDEHGIFFAAVSATRMPMIVTDPRQPDNPIVFANPAFLSMTGYSEQELIGRNCRLLQGPDTDAGTLQEVREAIAQRKEVAVEILNYKKDRSTFWNALFVSPVYDDGGELLYFFGSQLDVSRRRDAEDALRQAQKLEAVGQLTGGVAHDFNNLLTVIVGFGELLRSQLGDPQSFNFAKANRQLDSLMHAADRGSTLTQQLLAFARKQQLHGRVISLNDLVQAVLPIVARATGNTVQIELKLAEGEINVRLDSAQAELAIMNILLNARDAMPNGGRVTIETSAVEIDRGDIAFAGMSPGRYAALTITDTGTGIPEALLPKVTEPFFTTKEEGKGTGLGLSMVFGFARQSGGTLKIYSEVGLGTTVRLYFPAIEERARSLGNAESPNPQPLRGTETVLIVEDQVHVAELAKDMIEGLGYTVLEASNGPAALEVLKSDQRIDVLFTDLIMPGGMNGVALAREARRLRPKIKVLLTTGYADASIERSDGDGQAFESIAKPYKRLDLSKRLRQVILGPTGVS